MEEFDSQIPKKFGFCLGDIIEECFVCVSVGVISSIPTYRYIIPPVKYLSNGWVWSQYLPTITRLPNLSV